MMLEQLVLTVRLPLQAIADTWILKENSLTQPSNQRVVPASHFGSLVICMKIQTKGDATPGVTT